MKLHRKLRDAKWWVLHRLHPRHRYHVVKTDLPPGYYDEDQLILASCMALLGRYVEWYGGASGLADRIRELREETDPNTGGFCELNAKYDEEALAIYRWWVIDRPHDEKCREELCMELFGDDGYRNRDTPPWNVKYASFRALELKISDDEKSMLHRLVEIRDGLWT